MSRPSPLTSPSDPHRVVQEPAPAPAKKKRLLILAATSVVLAGGGAVALLGGSGEPAEGAHAPGSGEQEAGHGAEAKGHGSAAKGHKAEAGGGGGHGASAEPADDPAVLLEPFVLNLADREGDRFLRVSLRLVFDEDCPRPSAAEQVRLRDRLLSILSSKTADEVTSFEGKEALRLELMGVIARMFEESRVLELYFTEFLVQ